MKMVNCNNLLYHYIYGNRDSVSIPITDKLKLANGDSLYYSFIFGGYFDVLYNIIHKDGYFNEDD